MMIKKAFVGEGFAVWVVAFVLLASEWPLPNWLTLVCIAIVFGGIYLFVRYNRWNKPQKDSTESDS